MAIQWWNVTVKRDEEDSPYVKWEGHLPRWTREPRTFGEMGVARKGGKQAKTENRGFDGMMVGYEEESSAGTYRMYNLDTGKINSVRDVKWLDMLYGEYERSKRSERDEDSSQSSSTMKRSKGSKLSKRRIKEELMSKMEKEKESVDSRKLAEESEQIVESESEDSEEGMETRSQKNRSKIKGGFRKQKEIKELQETAEKMMIDMANFGMKAWKERYEEDKNSDEESSEEMNSEEDSDEDVAYVSVEERYETQYLYSERANYSAVESDYKEPRTYKQMLKRPEEERNKWKEGVEKEFRDFQRRGVWKRMKTSDVPEGRQLIGTKWVFKLKRNGVYRSRLVALGYT